VSSQMPEHELSRVLASADEAINEEDFDALMGFYAPGATLVVMPGVNAVGLEAIRKAFVAIADHFDHTLQVSQREVVVVEGADAALVLARTHVAATMKTGEPYDVERRATYVFRRGGRLGWECVIDNSYGSDLLTGAPR
jgi:uncharacterized protein (TIGR02246 family)